MFVSNGPFLVNSTKTNDQFGLSAINLDDGRILATFWSYSPTGSLELRGRYFDQSYSALGKDFLISNYYGEDPRYEGDVNPNISYFGGTSFYETRIEWNSFGRYWVELSSFDSTATGTTPLSYSMVGSLGYLSSYGQGNVIETRSGLMTFYSMYNGATRSDIFFSLSDKAGNYLSGPALVNTTTMGDQSGVEAIILDNGKILVGWQSETSVRFQFLRSNGTLFNGEHTFERRNESVMSVVHPEFIKVEGGFAVAYYDRSPPNPLPSDLHVRTFDFTGKVVSDVSVASITTTVTSGSFSIAETNWGGYAVVYDDGQLFGPASITVSLFTSYGRLLDVPLVIDSGTGGPHQGLSISFNAIGGGLVSWIESDLSLGDRSGTAVRSVVIDIEGRPFVDSDLGNAFSGGLVNEVVFGNGGDDTIYGGGGNDLLYGDSGNDVIFGGVGNDRLRGGAGKDKINGDDGDDFIDLEQGGGVAVGGNGNDLISGGSGPSKIFGGSGNDVLTVRDGLASVLGGSGDDLIVCGPGGGQFTGGSGNDTLEAAFMSVSSGGIDVFVFTPGDGNDEIRHRGSLNVLKVDLTAVGLGIGFDVMAHVTASGGNYTLQLGTDSITFINDLPSNLPAYVIL